ncbi:hypothetical protein GCM10010297_63440 [Streptomyces malachitofuscus]|nr:hypothetical protein GCM10010297_63440 [Streptomyces malachitofuscus]
MFARSGWRVRAPHPHRETQSRQSEDGHPRPGPAPPTRRGRQVCEALLVAGSAEEVVLGLVAGCQEGTAQDRAAAQSAGVDLGGQG